MRRFYVYDPLPTLQTLQTLNVPLLAVFGELIRLRLSRRMFAIKQILEQAGRRDYTPDGGSARQNRRVCPPKTIPTGFLRNYGRQDDNTASSARISKALGH